MTRSVQASLGIFPPPGKRRERLELPILWKVPQTPQSWMKTSCVWYSRLLASQLGLKNFQLYLATFDYGNQDASGGLTNSWLSSSLKISPREQVHFIQKIIQGKLPISNYAVQMTKTLLFVDALPEGWKLYGKTGLGSIDDSQVGWFVGWVEKGDTFFPFAYTICDRKINHTLRIPRVKQLIRSGCR